MIYRKNFNLHNAIAKKNLHEKKINALVHCTGFQTVTCNGFLTLNLLACLYCAIINITQLVMKNEILLTKSN